MKPNETRTIWHRSAASACLMLAVSLAPTSAMALGARPAPTPHHQVHTPSAYQGLSLGTDGSANAVEHRLLMAKLSRSEGSANAEEHRLTSR